MRAVRPFSFTTRPVRTMMVSAVLGSRAAVCSSRMRNFKGVMVAISRATAWRWPPGEGAHLHVQFILQPQAQGGQLGAVEVDPLFVHP